MDDLSKKRMDRIVGANAPGLPTVLARLKQVEKEVELGKEHANKCVIILLDDENTYYPVPYSAGMKPSEAAFLCEFVKDMFKGLLVPK